jgi:hypothetical protein
MCVGTIACGLEDDVQREALRAHYAAEGWVIVRGVVKAELINELQAATDSLQEEAAGIVESTRKKGVFFEVQSASGRARLSTLATSCDTT